jgi:hypothetical protein
MKHVIPVGGFVAALCVATMAHGQTPSVAEAGWAKMTRCATLGEDRARHTCTDNALREAGLLTEETKAAARRKTFGLQKPEPIAAAAAEARAPEGAASSAPKAKKEQNQQVEVKLAKVEQGGDRKLVLTTTDGAVWHQVESGAVRQMPKEGETMKIEARSLGGFMCEPSKYVSFRCYRSK